VTDALPAETAVGSYEQVAIEYYDAKQHPTCLNFRQASQILCDRLIPTVPAGRSCEVGAGDSLLAELFWRRTQDVNGLLLTDSSPRMLEYSRRWELRHAVLEVALASQLPVPDASLHLLCASLADPYDDDRFWKEAERVLTPGGQCVVTSPSATWVNRFRVRGLPRDAAEFELRDGSSVYLPSHVRPAAEERLLIERHGLRVLEEAEVDIGALDGPISEKLRVLGPGEPVVCGFLAEKPG
jgi:SAM-dependent methyltransferase